MTETKQRKEKRFSEQKYNYFEDRKEKSRKKRKKRKIYVRMIVQLSMIVSTLIDELRFYHWQKRSTMMMNKEYLLNTHYSDSSFVVARILHKTKEKKKKRMLYVRNGIVYSCIISSLYISYFMFFFCLFCVVCGCCSSSFIIYYWVK